MVEAAGDSAKNDFTSKKLSFKMGTLAEICLLTMQLTIHNFVIVISCLDSLIPWSFKDHLPVHHTTQHSS